MSAGVLPHDRGKAFTTLRPTLIYGKGGYAFQQLIRLIHAFPLIIPVLGDGNYLVRPVSVKDVVVATIAAIESEEAISNIYDLASEEVLSFNAFIDAICTHLKLKKCKVHLPFQWCLGIVKFVQLVYPKSLLGPDTLKRMVENPPIDIQPAIKDLGFHPIDLSQGLTWELAVE